MSFARLGLLGLVFVGACGDGLSGDWQGTHASIAISDEGFWSERDDRYPQESLTQIDPVTNPDGWYLRGYYSADGTVLTVDGRSGLYPLTRYKQGLPYALYEGQLLRAVFRRTRTDGAGAIGAWRGTESIEMTDEMTQVVTDAQRVYDLVLHADGTLDYTMTTTSAGASRTDTLQGAWQGSDPITLTYSTESEVPPTTLSLRPFGTELLADVDQVFTRRP